MAKKSAGIALGLAAALGIGLLAFGASPAKADTKGGGAPPGGGGGALPGGGGIPPAGDKGCVMDANIPPDVRSQVQLALSSPGLTKADYDQLAQTTAAAGYPMAAACLTQKGNAVAIQQQNDVNIHGGMPFTIRTGDIPYLLAQYYTGVPARFRELEPLNPQLGPLTNGPSPVDPNLTISYYPGWQVGTQILIPKAWNPLAKPLPPPATGGPPPPPAPSAAPSDGLSGAISSIISSFSPTG